MSQFDSKILNEDELSKFVAKDAFIKPATVFNWVELTEDTTDDQIREQENILIQRTANMKVIPNNKFDYYISFN